MSALPPDDARRLKGSLGRLASPHDGEVVAAAAAIGRLLEKHGLAFCDLGIGELVIPPSAPAANPWGRASGGSGPAELENDHQRTARVLLQTGYAWGEWELGFLRNACNRDRPSGRERTKLEELRQRFWNRRRAA